MSHSFVSSPRLGGLLALLLILAGCDAAGPQVPDTTSVAAMQFEGGLTADFGSKAVYAARATLVEAAIENADNHYRLDIQLQARKGQEAFAEEGQLVLRLLFASDDGQLPSARYTAALNEADVPALTIGEGVYSASQGNDYRSQYSFYGTEVSVDVEPSEPGRLKATFSVNLAQRHGVWIVNGVSQVATLASDARVTGTLDLPIERIEDGE